jgi:hypothetical protein
MERWSERAQHLACVTRGVSAVPERCRDRRDGPLGGPAMTRWGASDQQEVDSSPAKRTRTWPHDCEGAEVRPVEQIRWLGATAGSDVIRGAPGQEAIAPTRNRRPVPVRFPRGRPWEPSHVEVIEGSFGFRVIRPRVPAGRGGVESGLFEFRIGRPAHSPAADPADSPRRVASRARPYDPGSRRMEGLVEMPASSDFLHRREPDPQLAAGSAASTSAMHRAGALPAAFVPLHRCASSSRGSSHHPSRGRPRRKVRTHRPDASLTARASPR